ncbi:MAG: formate dehydrogenase subunit gamma [Burkholderiales bacterium]|nr:formate dehydrogenase subunit gamma [Burkholderiales bacterium]
MRNALALVAALLAAVLIPAAGAFAQSPALDPAEANAAKAQQQQQLTQPLNNEPLWSEVRSGAPQTTQVRGRETDILIQPEGQTWRALRNSIVAVWAGWAIVAMIVLIAAFYLWKGPLRLKGPRTGRKVRRFTRWQMTIHWATAALFVVLAVSGLVISFGKNLLLPIIGYTLFSWLTVLAKTLHNFLGPLFILCIVLLFFTFLRDNFWRRYDWNWLRRFGGLVSRQDVPSGKFNAGEKIWFWIGLLAAGVVVSVSGLVLDFPNFDQTRLAMQVANIVHLAVAALFILAALGHIYMGTIGMEGAYRAMSDGYVDETWAKEHHLYWYNDVMAGKVPAAPDDAPAPARAPRPASS